MASLEEILMLESIGSEEDEEPEGDDLLPAVVTVVRGRTRLGHSGNEAFAESEKKLKKNYRLSKALCRELIDKLRPYVTDAQRSSDLNIQTKVLIALNFFAQGSYQTPVGLHMAKKISQASVSKAIKEVVIALNHIQIFGQYVKFPSTLGELDQIAQNFYQRYGLPGVVGCIDCTHVQIVPPNKEEYDERSYVNRKGQHSINTQLICDSNLRIINVNALFPGSSHDSYIWNQSAVLPLMQGLHSNGHTGYYLIGDSGYPLRPWLHVPVPEPAEGTPEYRYMEAFLVARATIERCNGVLKARFRCLRKERGLHYNPEKASQMINACVVLHNICVNNNIELEEDDVIPMNLGMELPPLPQPPRGRLNQDLLRGQAMQKEIIRRYF